jgi:outer membrane protein
MFYGYDFIKRKEDVHMFKLGERQVHLQIIFALMLFMGIVGFSSNTFAASAANAVGVVDFQLLMSQHPDMAAARQTLKADMEQAQKDYDEKTQTMTTDEEKKAYQNQLQQRLNEKQDVLFGSVQAQVIAAVKEIAEAKGMSIVVDKSAAIYGGQDITAEVGKIILAKK